MLKWYVEVKAYFDFPQGCGLLSGFSHFPLYLLWNGLWRLQKSRGWRLTPFSSPAPFQLIIFLYNPREICFWLECSWGKSKVFFFLQGGWGSYFKMFQVCMKVLSRQQLKWRQLEIIKGTCSGQWLKQDGISTLSLSFYDTLSKLVLLLKLELALWLWELENYFIPLLSRDHSTDFRGCYCKWINEHFWN